VIVWAKGENLMAADPLDYGTHERLLNDIIKKLNEIQSDQKRHHKELAELLTEIARNTSP
jgi:hypothetical protein